MPITSTITHEMTTLPLEGNTGSIIKRNDDEALDVIMWAGSPNNDVIVLCRPGESRLGWQIDEHEGGIGSVQKAVFDHLRRLNIEHDGTVRVRWMSRAYFTVVSTSPTIAEQRSVFGLTASETHALETHPDEAVALAALRSRILTVAGREKKAHGWCSEIDEWMEKIDLPGIPESVWNIPVTIVFTDLGGSSIPVTLEVVAATQEQARTLLEAALPKHVYFEHQLEPVFGMKPIVLESAVTYRF